MSVNSPLQVRKHRKLFAIALLILLFLTAPWFVGEYRVRSELEKARVIGQSTTLSELAAEFEPLPEAEDATSVYRRIPLFSFPRGTWEGLPVVDDSVRVMKWAEPFREMARGESLLALAAPSLQLLHRAAEKGGRAQFFEITTLTPSTLLAHAQSLRHLSRLLAFEAFLCDRKGDSAGLARTLKTEIAVGNALDREPYLISLLVRLDVDTFGRNSLETYLGREPISEVDLRWMQKQLRSRDLKSRLRTTLECERIMALEVFGDLAKSEAQFSVTQKMFWPVTNRFSLAMYLSSMRDAIDAVKEPWPTALAIMSKLDANFPKYSKRNKKSAFAEILPPSPQDSDISIYIPIWRTMKKVAMQESLNRAADAAIAAELFRRDNNRLPNSLEELVPKYLPTVPIDSFTGDALEYVILPTGFEIATIGELKFDGVAGQLVGTRKAFHVYYESRKARVSNPARE